MAEAIPRRYASPRALDTFLYTDTAAPPFPPTGLDLQGNTYWEFRLSRRGGGGGSSEISLKNDSSSSYSASHQQTYPFRRIVHYPRSTHYSEVRVPPAWHQWLRYMRAEPPTLAEQRADTLRQERIKVLAAQADARWAAKPSLLDHPDAAARQQTATAPLDAPGRGEKGQPVPPFDTEHAQQTRATNARPRESVSSSDRPADASGGGGISKTKKAKRSSAKEEGAGAGAEDPWKAADARRGGPSETWQPQAWDPNAATTPRRR